MKVLIIAPLHPDLPNLPDEVGRLASSLSAKLVQGQIEEKDILSAIDDGTQYEGVWISSHASAQGILLSNGAILNIPALAQYLSVISAQWIVINSCESYEFVDQLQRYYPIDIVAASVKSLEDHPAWRTAALIARTLSVTKDLRTALQKASPGGASPHRFWPSPVDVVHGIQNGELDMNVEMTLRSEIKTVYSEMIVIRNQMQNEQHESAVKLAILTEKVGTIEKMFSVIQSEPAVSKSLMRGILIGIIIMCVFLFMILVVFAFRGAGIW